MDVPAGGWSNTPTAARDVVTPYIFLPPDGHPFTNAVDEFYSPQSERLSQEYRKRLLGIFLQVADRTK
jgi:hypothetical protein